MRMTSKMKLVLDNTDNSSHYRYVIVCPYFVALCCVVYHTVSFLLFEHLLGIQFPGNCKSEVPIR